MLISFLPFRIYLFLFFFLTFFFVLFLLLPEISAWPQSTAFCEGLLQPISGRGTTCGQKGALFSLWEGGEKTCLLAVCLSKHIWHFYINLMYLDGASLRRFTEKNYECEAKWNKLEKKIRSGIISSPKNTSVSSKRHICVNTSKSLLTRSWAPQHRPADTNNTHKLLFAYQSDCMACDRVCFYSESLRVFSSGACLIYLWEKAKTCLLALHVRYLLFCRMPCVCVGGLKDINKCS